MSTIADRKPRTVLGLMLMILLGVIVAFATSLLLWMPEALGVEPDVAGALPPEAFKWGFISAAAATGLSALSAGYAVATVGSAGVGALTERPELLGRVLILVGLAEGIAIYGLIVSILIINRLG
ncbi:MAG: ATP synthase subunit C [Wenzhouxiangellaceae bacterium]|nr:ATP synthase subunit C [Wenzhouxiangellaceae bacterium]